jgi:hypothetical protein
MCATALHFRDNQRSNQNLQRLLNNAERDIRRCFGQFNQKPLAVIEETAQKLANKITAVTCDNAGAREDLHSLAADLRCLGTRIHIAKRQSPSTSPTNLETHIDIAKSQSAADLRPRITRIGIAKSQSADPPPANAAPASNFFRLKVRLGKIEKPSQNSSRFHRVFATSNEYNQRQIREVVKAMKKIPDGAHFGVSGLHNWNLIAQMKSRFAVLVDLNPEVADFHRKMLRILCRAKSPNDFLLQATAQIKVDARKGLKCATNSLYADRCGQYNPASYRRLKYEEKLRFQLNKMLREDLALSKENFPFLQKMAKEGRIVPLYADLCNTKVIQEIADALHAEGLVFSSIYVSNIYDYLKKNPIARKNFQQNINAMKQDGTCIIDTTLVTRKYSVGSFIHYGKDPVTGNPYNPDIARGWLAKRAGKQCGEWVDTSLVDTGAYYKSPAPLEDFAELVQAD